MTHVPPPLPGLPGGGDPSGEKYWAPGGGIELFPLSLLPVPTLGRASLGPGARQRISARRSAALAAHEAIAALGFLSGFDPAA